MRCIDKTGKAPALLKRCTSGQLHLGLKAPSLTIGSRAKEIYDWETLPKDGGLDPLPPTAIALRCTYPNTGHQESLCYYLSGFRSLTELCASTSSFIKKPPGCFEFVKLEFRCEVLGDASSGPGNLQKRPHFLEAALTQGRHT